METSASATIVTGEHAAPVLTAVVKRDGRTVPYDRSRIAHAIEMALRAEAKVPYPDAFDSHYCDDIERVTDAHAKTARCAWQAVFITDCSTTT